MTDLIERADPTHILVVKVPLSVPEMDEIDGGLLRDTLSVALSVIRLATVSVLCGEVQVRVDATSDLSECVGKPFTVRRTKDPQFSCVFEGDTCMMNATHRDCAVYVMHRLQGVTHEDVLASVPVVHHEIPTDL